MRRLYQNLVPGISNVTLRTRYYGFYAWLSKDYAVQTYESQLREVRVLKEADEHDLSLEAGTDERRVRSSLS